MSKIDNTVETNLKLELKSKQEAFEQLEKQYKIKKQLIEKNNTILMRIRQLELEDVDLKKSIYSVKVKK